MKIGYARVSSADQSLELQLDALTAAGCTKIYREKASAKGGGDRPELERALDQLREGDELVVTRLDRIARSVLDLHAIVARIVGAGAAFHCLLQGAIDVRSATGKLWLSILGAVGEFERELLLERQREGIEARKAGGGYGGRKKQLDPERVKAAYREHGSYGKAAAALRCSRSSVERLVNDRPRRRTPCNTPTTTEEQRP